MYNVQSICAYMVIMVNESTGSRRWMIRYEIVAILSLLTVWFAYPASCSFDVILPTREVQAILGGYFINQSLTPPISIQVILTLGFNFHFYAFSIFCRNEQRTGLHSKWEGKRKCRCFYHSGFGRLRCSAFGMEAASQRSPDSGK